MRKKKELPVLEGVEIESVAAEGNAIARVDNMVVFIPYGAPGDVATVRLTRKKHSYAEGRIERLEKASPIRLEPRCAHFGLCGGCRWQHLPYEKQLEYKRRQVVDCLDRIAKVPHPEVAPALGSESIWDYRNKMEYTFSNKLWLTPEQMQSGEVFDDRRAAGFHIPGAFDKVLPIDYCHLQDAGIGNELRNFVKEFGKENDLSFYDLRANQGLLRTLMIRTASTGEVMALMSFSGLSSPKLI
ncbi:MAG: TRAM domain-containing protein, partial [Muribaculaceae bacterium]|nr:TRAM domain-containing protein [Muribaculaceae bacterium]